jgi:proteasome assembly chaperone (PAC2) family protein
MAHRALDIHGEPKLQNPCMVLGFSGWMDGGEISTGTIQYLVDTLGARPLADIDPADFFIYNFPGSMEVSALFRPEISIEDGMVRAVEEPANTFYVSEEQGLILFEGKEPNLRWRDYADCILTVAERFGVSNLYFVGSVASLVPHTRETRFFASVSHERLMPIFDRHDLSLSNYEGPGSFISFLLHSLRHSTQDMVSLVAETPMYYQGRNIKSIYASVLRLSAMMELEFDTSDLAESSREFEQQLNESLENRPELVEQVKKLEEEFDSESSEQPPEDLRDWFENQGLQFD